MKVLTALLLACLAGCSALAPRDDWTRSDTVKEIAFQALNVADAFQTAQIASHPRIEEKNPIAVAFIGRRPESQDVAVYFATTALTHYLIARALPAKWRRWWQGGTLVTSTAVVIDNCRQGLLCGGNSPP